MAVELSVVLRFENERDWEDQLAELESILECTVVEWDAQEA